MPFFSGDGSWGLIVKTQKKGAGNPDVTLTGKLVITFRNPL